MLSKNNDTDVAEVFDTRQGDLVLTSKHFATMRVDWNSKADNLVSIADELNLGVDSFVFIDDNDVELDEVRQRLPEVSVLKVTDEPSEIAELTAGLTAFRFAKVSDEDRQRTSMMQAEVRPQGGRDPGAVPRGVPRLAGADRQGLPPRSRPTSGGSPS